MNACWRQAFALVGVWLTWIGVDHVLPPSSDWLKAIPSTGIVPAPGVVHVVLAKRSSCQTIYRAPVRLLTETLYRIAASRTASPESGETTALPGITCAVVGPLH